MKAHNAGIDHIRILLTALVVLHHTAIAYGGSGGWYWREESDSSNLGLVAFNAINQSFFMGCFFLLAGYFSASTLARKDSKTFLKDRFKRLGWPLLVYLLLLSTFTNALANADTPAELWPIILWQWRNLELGVGPLWFCEALLIFSLVLVSFRKLFQNTVENAGAIFHSMPKLILAAVVVGLISFAVRLAVPVGEEVLWLQLGYFPGYIFLFYAGVAAWQGRVLENISRRLAIGWIVISLLCIATMPFAFSGALGNGPFNGGLNLNALFYALWNPLTGFGIIVFLLWFFQTWLSRSTPVLEFIARRAYAVFIIHPPVVVGFCLLFAGSAIAPIAKFFIVGGLSLVTCVFIGTLLLRIPLINRVI